MRSEVREHCVYVYDEISVRTVNQAAYRTFLQQCALPEIHAVNFSGVTRTDSVCLALLFATLRQARSGSLKYQSLPNSVQDLAQLYEVQEWINQSNI